MDATDALKRRMWRQALALTGGPEPAARVVESVLRVQPRLQRLAEHQRNRLVVQHSREVTASDAESAVGYLGLDGTRAGLVTALRTLAPQQREAWVLAELEGYDTIPAARAMDCSRTAMSRFLEEANDSLTSLMGEDYAPAIEGVRAAIDRADAEPSMAEVDRRHARTRARQRLWVGVRFGVGFVLMAWVLWAAVDLMNRPEPEMEPAPGAIGPRPEPAPEERERLRRMQEQAEGEPAGREIER